MPFADAGVADTKTLVAGGALLLDVRTDPEVARGIIPGARHVVLQDLPSRLDELPRSGSIVVYCQSGGRSAHAANFLASQGFGSVYNLQGGILAWLREGEPIEQPKV